MSTDPIIKHCVICGAPFRTIPRLAMYCKAHRDEGQKIRIERKRKRRLATDSKPRNK
jgi:hypothetical protein